MKTLLIGNGYWGGIIKPKLEKLTTLVGVANSKNNIDVLLENNKDVDFVFVCTPTRSHYDIVRKCIINKINVFCEKPFTGDVDKANELYDLAEKYGVLIFVDNIFLYRSEFLNYNKGESKHFNFIWYKHENEFKDNLLYTLLYHDIYLLIKLTDDKWVVNNKNINDIDLNLQLINGDKIALFKYNRKYKGKKIKSVCIDDTIIDFSTPQNDPLLDIINNLISKNLNFTQNKKLTLETLNIIKKINENG